MSIALDARQVPEDPQGTELRCPACDYDLRALVGDRYPECGLQIDRAALAQSQIPWAHRDRLGSIRAYQRTAWPRTAMFFTYSVQPFTSELTKCHCDRYSAAITIQLIVNL